MQEVHILSTASAVYSSKCLRTAVSGYLPGFVCNAMLHKQATTDGLALQV